MKISIYRMATSCQIQYEWLSYLVSITSPLNISYLHCIDEDIKAQKGQSASQHHRANGLVTHLSISTSALRTHSLILCVCLLRAQSDLRLTQGVSLHCPDSRIGYKLTLSRPPPFSLFFYSRRHVFNATPLVLISCSFNTSKEVLGHRCKS